MDALHWISLQRDPMPDSDPKPWAGTEEGMRRCAVYYSDSHHSQHGHYSHHQREPLRHSEWMEGEQRRINILGHGPPGCREQSADVRSDANMDPGGPPEDITERDNELERKKKQLEEIQNRIIKKKAAIALKKIAPFLKESDEPDAKTENQLLETCLNPDEVSLKDRVKCILQLKKSLGLPKVSNAMAL